MDLTFLSSLLDLSCFRSWIVGSPLQTTTGEPLSGVYTESYWASRLEFPGEGGFGKQLFVAIERLVNAEKIVSDLRESGGKIEIYLQLSGAINNGDTIKGKRISPGLPIGVSGPPVGCAGVLKSLHSARSDNAALSYVVFRSRRLQRFYSSTTGLLRIPIPSISTSTTSPCLMRPTPLGVPVAIRSPGMSVKFLDMNAMVSAIGKIM